MNVDNLNTMTVKELLALPEAAEIKGRHKMKKADLIAALVALSPEPVIEETPAEPEVVIVTERQMISPVAALAAIAAMAPSMPMPVERSHGGPRMSDAERRRLKEQRKKRKHKAKIVKASKKRNRKAA